MALQKEEPLTFVLGYGRSDTHAPTIDDPQTGEVKDNPHPSAGHPYGGISGKEIAAMVVNPACEEKENAPWFIGSTFKDCLARQHEAQRQNGLYHILPVDIDKGAPSLDKVERAVIAALGEGVSHIIYSSSSATVEEPKWRILFFVDEPVSGEDYKETQQALFALLNNNGLICDQALDRTGQLIFLPNVPPSKRNEDGTPLFYQHKLNRAKLMKLDESSPVYRRREAIRADVVRALEAAREIQARKQNLPATEGDNINPIDEFNKAHSLDILLEKYGYKRQGRSHHWQSPNQSSGSYAVRTYDGGTWVSLSGSDMAAGIGASKDYCCYGDAFDLFRHYEHNGDQTAAVRAYGQEINPTAGPTVVRLNIPVRATMAEQAQVSIETSTTEAPSTKPKREEPESPLEKWAYLSGDNEFYHTETGQVMGVSAFNLAMSPITPTVEVEKPNGDVSYKKLQAAKTLIDHMDGAVVHGSMYRPDIDVPFFSVEGVEYVNSYLPCSTPAHDPNWRANDAWRVCEAHIQNILGEDAKVIIQWMAHNVQKPGKKILWAPVIVGVQGDGKTTLSKMLASAMGVKNVSPVSPESMFSDFTAWAEGSCVKVLEEIRVHGNNRYDAMNKLKPLITNDTVEVVRKGKDGKQVINVTNYMALTNHMDALALDDGDRRWGVFKTRFESRAQMLSELDDTYWQTLHSAIDCHSGAIRGWLLDVDISGFNRVAGPDVSAFKRAMIDSTKPADQQDVEQAIELGWLGVSTDLLATDCLNSALFDLSGVRMNTRRLAAALDLVGFVKVEGTLKWRQRNRKLWRRKGAGLSAKHATELREILDQTSAENEGWNGGHQ